MEPLYCYKYDMATQELTEICITHYNTKTNTFTGRSTYTWDDPKVNKSYTHESVPDTKLDRFVNGKVFTFTQGEDHALDIILDDISRRHHIASEEYRKWSYAHTMILEKIRKRHNA